MLTRAGLGHDPALSQPSGDQRLPERVVDLVRAGMGEVLALEPDARSPRVLGQAFREVHGRRASDEVAREERALPVEVGVGERLVHRGLEFVERRHHGLRYEPPAEFAEPTQLVRRIGIRRRALGLGRAL